MPYGLHAGGFTAKRLTDIILELQQAAQAKFGDGINLQDETPIGQFIGIFSESVSEAWEVLEAIYSAVNPNGATGVPQDIGCELVGVLRNPATYSKVTVTCTGTPATVIPKDTQFAVYGNESIAIFETDAEATIAGGGTIDVACTCISTGAISANAGALIVIVTPVSGLTSVTNALDTVLGDALETDGELRLRRSQELQQSEGSSLEAIRVAVKDNVENVTAVAAFENVEGVTDGDGRPPHSIHLVVKDGTNQDIGDEIWDKKSGGVKTHGSETVTVTDSQGLSQTVYFDRPSEQRMYIIVDIERISGTSIPSEAEVKAQITEYANGLNMSDDVLPQAEILEKITELTNIKDISLKISVHPTTPPTVDTPIVMDADELATFDTGDMTVNFT